jgi:hypothetical protein
MPLMQEDQISQIMQPTPSQYIEMRPGRGNTRLAYVTVSYVIWKLNEVFGFDWDVKYGEPLVDLTAKNVTVKTTLTVRGVHAEGGAWKLVKEQFGQDDLTVRNGEAQGLGDSIKSAASDGLKKCASLLGLFFDVYSGQVDANGHSTMPAPGTGQPETGSNPPQMPEVPMPATAEQARTQLYQVAHDHFNMSEPECRRILRQSGFDPGMLPERFIEMLDTLRQHAA